MIVVSFIGSNPKIGFKVSGHSGYAESGKDIVCSAVTSVVEMTANAITEVLKVDAKVIVGENEISLSLPTNPDARCYDFLEALYLHLSLLSQDYGKNIKVIVTEV
ncbi:MAG: ribosomal-processing cysteine protease Prp [Oscillospiraceae bacterium]